MQNYQKFNYQSHKNLKRAKSTLVNREISSIPKQNDPIVAKTLVLHQGTAFASLLLKKGKIKRAARYRTKEALPEEETRDNTSARRDCEVRRRSISRGDGGPVVSSTLWPSTAGVFPLSRRYTSRRRFCAAKREGSAR